jgi:hypothetical protein
MRALRLGAVVACCLMTGSVFARPVQHTYRHIWTTDGRAGAQYEDIVAEETATPCALWGHGGTTVCTDPDHTWGELDSTVEILD